MPKTKTTTARAVAHVKAKAKKPSTYASVSGLAATLAGIFPQYAPILLTVGAVAGFAGSLMPGAPAGGQEAAP